MERRKITVDIMIFRGILISALAYVIHTRRDRKVNPFSVLQLNNLTHLRLLAQRETRNVTQCC